MSRAQRRYKYGSNLLLSRIYSQIMVPSGQTFSIVIGALSAVLVYKYVVTWRQSRADAQFAADKGCQPLKPWSAKWPLGLDLLIKAFRYDERRQALRFFTQVWNESGTTFEQHLLFSRGVDTMEPENLKAILSTHGIFTQDGAQWRHSRELLPPQFKSNRFDNFEQIKDAVNDLIANVPDDGVVDLQPLFFRLTFETTLFLLFGQHLPSLKSEGIFNQEEKFSEAFNTGPRLSVSLFVTLGFLRSPVARLKKQSAWAQKHPTPPSSKSRALLSFTILRLYPSVPVNSRAAGRTTTLPTGGGPKGTAPVLIRKGEAIGYSVYVLHRRKDIYGPDADEFRPGRWENGALNNVGYGYLPFNGGPRICLGQEFALLEAAYTVVRLLQTYETIEMERAKSLIYLLGMRGSS
ncbi:hypothetical protein PENFLA_c001G04217 [Penicillium flavigenum]|uniref:Cytochrome P450 n=1 Tax=Penicillium flavigenum TaxID=254877 RepID=A0A1V6U2L8_9EURO|nr:hypothetical protein PENFLA_c001G04217 [Penicillium flavigenum]